MAEEETELKIPVYWEGIPPKTIQYGLKFGLLKLGWTLKDYVLHAVNHMGYETNLEWGVQGSGKSNRILQEGGWVYCTDKHDYEGWRTVLDNLIMRPTDFVRKLKDIPLGQRVPWIGWDDIGVHFPSARFRTDVKQYEAIDATWTAIRTKCNVISLSIPLIDRLAKNIRDNLTNEVFIGRNQNILIERYIRLPGLKRLESNFFKVQIEPIHNFDLFDVPTDIFKEYWDEMRLPLAEEALEMLDRNISPENMMPVYEVAKLLGISTMQLVNFRQRGGAAGKVINGVLHFTREEVRQLQERYKESFLEKE